MADRYPTPPDEIPAEPIDWPDRLSQTLLRTENRCPRSAYYYVKYSGTSKSHPMDRGTLAHSCAEHLMLDRIQHEGDAGPERAGQPLSYEIDLNLPVDAQEPALSMSTGALVDEQRRALADRTHIPSEEADIARICTFHLALGLDVDPETVLGLERKFVLDLGSGWEVSVKADLISLPDAFGAQVDDYKTLPQPTPASEWDAFQVKVAAVALLYGYPVDRIDCDTCGGSGAVDWEPGAIRNTDELGQPCPDCGGRGSLEVRGPNAGGHLHWVRGREIYPRPRLRRDGTLHMNTRVWTRLELDEFRADLEFAGERIAERLISWKWPARKGSWCNECAGRWECPIVPELRGFAGAVEDREHAGQMWQLAMALKDMAGDLESVVKEWSAVTGESVEVGDLLFTWLTTESRAVRRKGKTTDWDGFEAAVAGAVERGDPFELGDWVKTQRRNEFKKTKIALREGEVPHVGNTGAAAGGDDAGGREQQLDAKFGADAPY